MQRIIIVGGGGHAKVIASIIKKLGTLEIIGYTDNEDRGLLLGMPYLGTDEALSRLQEQYPQLVAVLGVGHLGKDDIRERLVWKLRERGVAMPAIVSPRAIVNEEVEIGEGTVVMDGVVINSGSRVGRYVILNTRSSIDHDCDIGDFTHIAPGATLSGGVKIGARVLVGVGATVIQYKTIGEHAIVAAGAVVIKDVPDRMTVKGVPAQ